MSHGWEQERAGESARMNDVRARAGEEGGPAVNRAARCPGLRRPETPPSAPPEPPGARPAAAPGLRRPGILAQFSSAGGQLVAVSPPSLLLIHLRPIFGYLVMVLKWHRLNRRLCSAALGGQG